MGVVDHVAAQKIVSIAIWQQLKSKIKHTSLSVSVLFETQYHQQFKK